MCSERGLSGVSSVGGTGRTRAPRRRLHGTGPYERNRAERNQRATARRNANGSRNRGRAARGPAPPARHGIGKHEVGSSRYTYSFRTRRTRPHGVAGRRAGCIPERSAVFALRLRCARCACGLYVLRTPLPPSPVYRLCPTNAQHRTCDAGRRIRGVVCVRVCPSVLGRGVDKSQDCGPPWSSEEAEEFREWWWGRRGRGSKEHGEALVVVVAHTCGDEDGDADEQ